MGVTTYDLIPSGEWGGFDDAFPSGLRSFSAETLEWDQPGDTAYVFVHRGAAELFDYERGTVTTLLPGMFAEVPGRFQLRGGHGVVFERHGYRGVFLAGGPVERAGRLRYIDGCTDSLLIGPARLGDPCLNHLHFPPGVDQTAHTHPSCRLGVVHKGRGECETPDGVIPLEPGTLFAMTPGSVHKFRTRDSAMQVIAFHPDSDTGPSDDDHPMVNRTIVGGVSARDIPGIRTR